MNISSTPLSCVAVIDRLRHSIPDVDELVHVASRICGCSISAEFVASYAAKITRWQAQVRSLLERPMPAQKSDEWHRMRQNAITASDIAQSVGEGKFGTQRDFIIKKVDPSAMPFDESCPPLMWGIKYEDVARFIYCKRFNAVVHDFGLLLHPSVHFIGASPDGITTDGIMLEIKAPYVRKIDGTVPHQYYSQIQVQLDVCDLEECDYLECELEELGLEDFLKDVTDGRSEELVTALGNEKGVVVSYDNGKKHMYPPDDAFDTVQGAMQWVDAALAQLTNQGRVGQVTYWRLNKMLVQRVTLNRAYVTDLYQRAGRVWDMVLRYRADPIAFKTEILDKRRSRPAAPPKPVTPASITRAAATSVCMIDDD